MMSLFVKLALAMAADRLFGEARRWHPLVGFGRLAHTTERLARAHLGQGRISGFLAWSATVLPPVALAWWVRESVPGAHWVIDISLLYLALGGRSLAEHADAIAMPLARENLPAARASLALVVSRDTESLSSEAIARAGVETVLENGHDAVFGALFWFCLLGGPGALLFRLANTLDAMWGYRNPRYLSFGWLAARCDDLLGWMPARLTALTYALLGRTRDALSCWRQQAAAWSSPNAGPVMAAGAGALGVHLGGPASYQGRSEARPILGTGQMPDANTIREAVRLVRNGAWLWLAVIAVGALVHAL